jgi:16S rRNA (adenine1518-N6/adenine1519-N6)-dimethyltransferase
MERVRAKKHLGQHFLKDKAAAEKIAALIPLDGIDRVVEIGPGMGVLTEILYPVWQQKLWAVEIDKESVVYLHKVPWAAGLHVVEGDFLRLPESQVLAESNTAVIGNYPYNISTQIAFKVMENASKVSFFGGMFQREVARRFCSIHGNKEYGVTSVLLQSLFDCEYVFTVDENAFSPAPKVKSGVMRCLRKKEDLECNFKSLSLVVKTAFNQRRKTMHNAMKSLTSSRTNFVLPENWAGKRAEQLSVEEFIFLARAWENAAT